MPIYEYLCAECGTVSEFLVFTEKEEIECPNCSSKRVKKLLSTTSTASGTKQEGRVPGGADTGCCGSKPAARGCVPGSCCGKA
jgi:putative FmdB family regulatory protein